MSGISRRAALVSLLTLVSGACASERPSVQRLVIATGGTGGVYDALGQSLAAVMRRRWSIEVVVRRSGASIENLHLVAEGKADLGFASIDSIALAVAGYAPFTEQLPINSLAQLYDDYIQVVTLAHDQIHDLGDLMEADVSVGAPGSGTELIALRLLRLAGVSRVRLARLGVADSANALRKGEIKGFFFSGGLPTPAIANLAMLSPIRLVPIDSYLPQLQQEHGGVYVPRTVPGNTYRLPADVATIGMHNLLITRNTMSTDLAYLITSLLFDFQTELAAAHSEARHLHERTAIFTVPVPLHPGAVRYYREAKYGF